MSGSGGGNWPPEGELRCEALRFETQLASPQPAALQLIEEGFVLEVGILPVGALQVLQVVFQGQMVGGLAGGLVARLRECILRGARFQATVLSKDGALVRLRIEPRSA